jgi:molybdopterin synthase sulfur carrier subunit
MLETTAMVTVSLHYWAGAKAAAGVDEEAVEAASVAAALEVARDRRKDLRFERVLAVSSILVDGQLARTEDLDATLTQPVRVEILPPFDGG